MKCNQTKKNWQCIKKNMIRLLKNMFFPFFDKNYKKFIIIKAYNSYGI